MSESTRFPAYPWRDPIILIAGLAALSFLVLYTWPGVESATRDSLGIHLAWPLRLLIIIAFLYRPRRASLPPERRFWFLLATAIALWVAGGTLMLSSTDPTAAALANTVEDGSFLLFYLCIVLAIGQAPHLGGARGPTMGDTWSLATCAFLGWIFATGVVVALLRFPDVYLTYVPTYIFFVLADIVITGRVVTLARRAGDRRWRHIYVWVAIATGAWLVTDLVDLLVYAEVLPTMGGAPFFVIWNLPYFALVIASRVPGSGRQAGWYIHEPRPGRPALHLAMYGAIVLGVPPLAAWWGWIPSNLPPWPVSLAGALGFGLAAVLARRTGRRAATAPTVVLTEEGIEQSRRMEALGRLAGGVAHDFNSLLVAMQGYAELLATSTSKEDRRREYVDEIRGAIDRAAGLTNQLLAVSRAQVVRPVPLDLGLAVDGARGLLNRLSGADVEMEVCIAATPVMVKADPGQITQILLNLVANAGDAMPEGGRLAIEVRPVRLETDGEGAPRSGGEYALLEVRDTGKGMDAETRDRAFEPFFTRRDHGVGTGLGLATVHGIVTQIGGHLSIDSEPGRGATMRVYLPRTLEAKEEAPAPVPDPAPVEQAPATILLAEDDASIRRLSSRYLEECGFRVLAAEDGRQALDIAAEEHFRFDALLTDVVMPGVDGLELARRVRAERPDVRVLFVSGYTDHLPDDTELPGATFLEKPFALNALRDALTAALAD